MNDEHEVDEQPTKPRGQTVKKEQPETPPALPPRQESNTVSLLDLMREAVESDAPTREERKSETDQVPSRQGSGGVPADEAPTVTSAPEPEKPARSDPARYPLAPDQLAPPDERPLVHDQDATTVQPRVAFPRGDRARQDRPIPDAPTEQYRPLRTPGQRQPPAAGPRTPGRETQPRPAAPQGTLPRQRPEPTTVIIPAQSTGRPYPRSRRQGNWQSCITRLLLIGVILVLAGAALGIAGAAIGYSIIARGLPSPTELSQRASTFETARIYDRDGNLLYSLADPTTGNRTRVSLDQISPYLIEGTIAIEDARFYDNPGFDPIGITRAVVQAAQEGEIVSGASTITQQLVRALLLDEEERTQRTFSRKVREIILAAEISRTYDKEEILELYLNEIYYGNLAYGIEAAAQTYFRKSAADLTLAEASLLAGLPQAPALWDPYTAPDKAIARQWQVLSQMVAEGYVTLEEAQAALDEANIFVYNLEPPVVTIRHPHFTFTVLQQAEERLGAQSIYRGGLRIYTTLDPRAQQLAEATVEAQRANVNAAGANNAAMVVLEPETGQILALVGSVDFNSEAISGQVNMALAPRQPGSTIKPLVYLAAMEQGWTPATLIWDVPTQFPNGTNPPYVPKNYDDEFHGPLLLRPALGNSYNIPAVKALEFVGVCNFIDYVPRLGLTSLQDEGCREVGQPRNYGLSLALGGGEISPLEMASAFAVLANQGRYAAPFAITRIDNNQGELIFEHTPTSPEGAQVIRSEHAFLLSNILSDNNARQPEFGVNNPLVIPGRQVAAKTGTSGSTVSDVRDAWTIGYTPQVVTAVWVGNTNNEPISRGQSGGLLAAPIWNSFMNQYLADKPAVDFVRPPGIVDMQICTDSGTRPGPDCPNTRTEVFAQDQLPLESDRDFLQKIPIDLWTHLRANETCPESVYEATFFDLLVTGNESVLEREQAAATQWLVETAAGQNWAARRNLALPLRLPPSQSCDSGTIRPQVSISQPESGAELIDVVEIRGTALGPNFNGYVAEYGVGQDPGGWGRIQEHRPDQVDGGVLALWDTTAVNYSGPATVRVVIFGPDNPFTVENDPVTLEARVSVNLLQPTATPTTTPTETATPTATSLPTETPTSTVTPSPTATSTPAIIVTVAPTSEPTVDVDTDSTATPQSTPTP